MEKKIDSTEKLDGERRDVMKVVPCEARVTYKGVMMELRAANEHAPKSTS